MSSLRVVVNEGVVLHFSDAVRRCHVAAHQFGHDGVDGCVARLHFSLYAYDTVTYFCKDSDSLQIDAPFGVWRYNLFIVTKQCSGHVDHKPTVFSARMRIRNRTCLLDIINRDALDRVDLDDSIEQVLHVITQIWLHIELSRFDLPEQCGHMWAVERQTRGEQRV
jgi:hypothetical protein